FFLREQFGHALQNLDAADVANRFVRVWKMLTDVARADCAEQRVRDRMRQNIRVRVAFQTARVRDLDTAEHQSSSLRETMDVVTDAATNHRLRLLKWLKRSSVEVSNACITVSNR